MNTNEDVLPISLKDNLIKIEQQLKEYILANYDINDQNIAVKFTHTFRTKLVSDQICEALKLSERDCYIASIVALFHDYARFEQTKRFGTFNDLNSLDHGDLAVELLFDNKQIFNFVSDLTEEELDLIYKAIKNHNKFKIEEGLNEKQTLFCNIIRDADKLDIFRIVAFDPRCNNLQEGYLKTEDIDNFYNHVLYKKKKEIDFYDLAMLHISLIYDFNYHCSFEILNKEKYLKMYMYTLLLWATFKVDEDLLDCFDYAERYVKEKCENKG